jgi:F0F1-type ATP synthase assembly protein I
MVDERSDDAHPDGGLRGRDLIGLGGLLVAAVVVCTVLGMLLDHGLGSAPAFTVGGVGVGIVLAGVGFWLRVRSALRG